MNLNEAQFNEWRNWGHMVHLLEVDTNSNLLNMRGFYKPSPRDHYKNGDPTNIVTGHGIKKKVLKKYIY